MAYTINDKALISEICEKYSKIIGSKNGSHDKWTGKIKEVFDYTRSSIQEEHLKDEELECAFCKMEHPLDKEVMDTLTEIIGSQNEIPYSCDKKMDQLWRTLIEKSIKCLRFFDSREPFLLDSNKVAIAHGIEKLENYHNKYTKFESLLYGASEYYRDHVFHVIRTWLTGVLCLLHEKNDPFINKIQIDGITEKSPFADKINFFEKISIWTISALCHDLGYPLEKSQQIIEKTKDMMKEFIPNPTVLSNFSFSGVQDNINEYIVRFMSTKMKEKTESTKVDTSLKQEEKNITPKFVGRIQPKYYLKYTKSLERSNHGIISAIIIYKMLLYFVESDFNLNDDYVYTLEDARQFYIRREILRSISSHTCSDIYNIKNNTFSSLLFICDEMQEWGRKSWKDLYTNISPKSVELSIEKFDEKNISYHEKIKIETLDKLLIIDNLFRLYDRQFKLYQLIFRDGQYTNNRNFDINKTIELEATPDGAESNIIKIEFKLLARGMNEFKIDLSNSSLETEIVKSEFVQKMNGKPLPPYINIS